MRISGPLLLQSSSMAAFSRVRQWLAAFAARVAKIDLAARFTPRTLAITTVISIALCLVSVAALAVIVLKSGGAAGKPVGAAMRADRAWLSPVSIAIARAPLRSDGKPRIDITLNYVNVGAEPARGVVVSMRSGTVPQDVISPATLNAIYAGENATCDGLVTPDKGGMVFPSSTVARNFSQTDIIANEDTIQHLQGVLVVQACLKYQTANGAIHTTKLCQYVEPELDRPLDQRRLRACADGNDAN
jgi:hypothetical protein